MHGTPKIRGYVAEDRNRIVLLYRRSGKVTYVLVLNYEKGREKIKVGSKFFGRFYPNRCDLSPDGKHFLYFAMGKSQKNYEKKMYCWTAICRPPDVHALFLLAHDDTWGGGGRFIEKRNLIFIAEGMYPQFETSKNHRFDKYDVTFDKKHDFNDWASGRGWKAHLRNKLGFSKIWIKKKGNMTIERKLNKHQELGEYSLHRYRVFNRKNGKLVFDGGDDVQWMDFDNFGRVIAARGRSIEIYNDVKAITRGKKKVFDLEKRIRAAA